MRNNAGCVCCRRQFERGSPPAVLLNDRTGRKFGRLPQFLGDRLEETAIFSNMRRLLNPSEVIANMMVEPLPGDVPISVEIRGAGVAG